MLDGLDEVPWATLTHAYGPANDVPRLLRQLRDHNPSVREQARRQLYGSIAHQGTRYSATVPAVGFLTELILADDTPERHELVDLLAFMAIGNGSLWLPDGIDPDQLTGRATDPSATPTRRQDARWALAAYQATSPAIPHLLGLLEERDPRLRAAGAHLIAWFPQHAGPALLRLRTQLAVEPDLSAKATMVVAVGLLAGARQQTSDAPALTRLLDTSDPVLRWAAAIALARLFVDDPPERAVQELLPWATSERVPPTGRQPSFDDMDRYALSAIVRPGLAARRQAADALLARLAVLDAHADAEFLVWSLLEITFDIDHPDGWFDRHNPEAWRSWPSIQFSALQQHVLRGLAAVDRIWQPGRNGRFPAWSPLRGYRLPCTRRDLLIYSRP